MEEINEKLLKHILKNGSILPFAEKSKNLNVVLETDLYNPPQGALSNSSFVRLDDHEVSNLFVKFSKTADNMESYNFSTFFNDAYFHSKIVPFFQTFGDTSSFLQNYLGSSLNLMGTGEKCAMLAENLQAAGYQHRSPKSRWDYPHLALVLQKLGELHAFSYKAKSLKLKRFYSLVSSLAKNIESSVILIIEMLKGNLIDVLKNIPQDKDFMEGDISSLSRVEYIVENMLTQVQKQLAVDPDTDTTLVLCHGDPNPLNFMFKYENGMPMKVKFVDFSNCQLGSPTLDVVYFLYCATDQKMRLEHWDDLVDVYYSALKGAFADNIIPAKSSIIDNFPLQALYPCLIGLNWSPYLMAIDEVGENVPENFQLSDIAKVAKTKTAERISLFKDMVQRGFI